LTLLNSYKSKGKNTMPKKPYEPYARDFRAALRVKIKSLAAEAKIIRREEDRAKSWHEWLSLKEHRRTVVRSEARAAQLALAFLRGIPYEKVEPFVHPGHEPNWSRVAALAVKYAVPPHLTSWSQRANAVQVRTQVLENFKTWAPDTTLVRYAISKAA
jgi:hypothetical protein